MSSPSPAVTRRVRRFYEQRWLLDAAIRTIGVDWDQGRSRYLLRPCGFDAEPDFVRIRERVKKLADIEGAFVDAARRREGLAEEALREDRPLTARDHYFTAAVLWGGADWPLFEDNERAQEYDRRKTRCYQEFAARAPHPVRRVEIPFGDAVLPGYLHLPPGRDDAPAPCVVSIPGMDSFKEISVPIYGDKFLERGIARLCVDGPGQGEALVHGLKVTAMNHADAGQAVFGWLRRQPEVDPARVGLHGTSMGSFWATQAAAAVEGLSGCAVVGVCHEPGMRTIFNSASPTFKVRYMYMAGYEDEDEFDRFAETLTLEGVGRSIACPYLAVAGEDDELSPPENTLRLLEVIPTPKKLVVYQGERHSLGSGPAAQFGPNRDALVADWFLDRFAGRPMASERAFVDSTGRVSVSPLD